MKKLLIFLFLLICSNVYGTTYNATVLKNMGTNTPLGSENPNIIDDSIRETRTLLETQYHELVLTSNGTASTTDTYIIGSSSSGILCSFPSASSVANGTTTKTFVVKNRGAGTVTLSPSVDGVGSPTVSQNQAMTLFTDGTSWFEVVSNNAYDSDYLGGVVASGYARSGANSDITSLTGITTALPISEGGTGQTTAAAARTAFGVGTGDTPTFTGVVATGSSTLTTLNSTTENTTNLIATTGTITTLYNTTENTTNLVATTGTVTTLYSTTENVTNLVATTGTVTTLYSTTGNITTGNVTNLVTTTGTVTTLNSTTSNITTGNVTNLATTTGTVTTLYSTTGNITTGNVTNLVTTTGTITTLNNTNLSGGVGTVTGNLNVGSLSGINFLSNWRSGSTIGYGTVTIQGGGDIVVTPTHSSGNGTITISLAGSASSKANVKYNNTQVIGNASDINFNSPLKAAASGTTEAIVTLDHINLATETSGLISFATQTTGLLSFATQTTGRVSFATQTSGLVSMGSQTTGLLSWNNIDNPVILTIAATTTAQTGSTTASKIYVSSAQISIMPDTSMDANTKLMLRMEGTNTSQVFVDSSTNNYTVTTYGNTYQSTSVYKFGAASGYFDGAGDYLSIPDDNNWTWGTNDMTIRGWFNPDDATSGLILITHGDSADNFWYINKTATGKLNFYQQAGSGTTTLLGPTTHNVGSWNHFALTKQGQVYRIFLNGSMQFQITQPQTFSNYDQTLKIGVHMNGVESFFKGYLDNIEFINGTALYTGTFTAPTANITTGTITQYTTKVVAPGTGTNPPLLLKMETFDTVNNSKAIENEYAAGTPTVNYFPGSTTVFNATTQLGTSTLYAGQFNGGVLSNSGFFTLCFDDIKVITDSDQMSLRSKYLDSFYNMNIKESYARKSDIGWLEATKKAKEKYKQDNYKTWKDSNIDKYYVTENVPGSGTSKSLQIGAMEKDYKKYIEENWKSDSEQNDYIQKVKDEEEIDKSRKMIRASLSDPSTPEILKATDGSGLSLDNQIGMLNLAVKELNERLEKAGIHR